jgi:hypothetical protein
MNAIAMVTVMVVAAELKLCGIRFSAPRAYYEFFPRAAVVQRLASKGSLSPIRPR